jgi:MFS family permease
LFAALIFIPAPKLAGHASETSAREVASRAPWTAWIGIFLLMSVGCALIFPPAYELGALLQEKALGSSWLTGLGVAILAAGAVVSAFSVPALRRISPPVKVAIAVGSSGLGTIMIAQATTLVPIMAGAALVGVGQGMLGPVLSIWLLEATPEHLRGRAVGLFQTTTFLTLFVAPLAARWLAIGLESASSGMRVFALGDLALVLLLAIMPVVLRRRLSGLASSS